MCVWINHIEVLMEHKYMQNCLTQALTTLSNQKLNIGKVCMEGSSYFHDGIYSLKLVASW